MSLAPGDRRHGTTNGYCNLGCRCDPCKAAQAVSIAEQRAARIARGKADPSVIPHGTSSGYTNWVCRCQPCREAAGYKAPASTAECGTMSAYTRHHRNGEPPCDLCREAQREYNRERYRRAHGGRDFEPQPCGTNGGYYRHYRKGEPACDPCRIAHNQKQRGGTAPRTRQPCGTLAAYARHSANGEKPCGPCKAAAMLANPNGPARWAPGGWPPLSVAV